MKLNCVITDDEPRAQELLESYIGLVPGLTVVATCSNATETLSALEQNEVDVLFLDIHMPGMSGLDLVRSLETPPAIVFTTAYPNYAMPGLDVQIVDYLLKPISIDHFLRAVDKVYQQSEQEPSLTQFNEKQSFFIKSNVGLIEIRYDSICYVEDFESYVKIHCEHKAYISLTSMADMEEMLAAHRFLRIHHLYLVNLSKVSSVNDHTFKLGNTDLAIGKGYRDSVVTMLKQLYP